MIIDINHYGQTISAQTNYTDNAGNSHQLLSPDTNAIEPVRAIILGTYGNDTFLSSEIDEIFTGKDGADKFIFEKKYGAAQGFDKITDYNKNEDSVDLLNYSIDDLLITLDRAGNDRIVFSQEQYSEVIIENHTVSDSLSLINLSNESISLTPTDSVKLYNGTFSLENDVKIDYVKLGNLNSFKETITINGETVATDPIDLKDVLVQLKHIIGLKALKANAFQAGDSNNDGSVDLTDVLANLKHIIGLKEIDTFDLVTDNGFALNSLNTDSHGNLTLVINGDADQSHANWELL